MGWGQSGRAFGENRATETSDCPEPADPKQTIKNLVKKQRTISAPGAASSAPVAGRYEVVLFFKRPGSRGQVRFAPGCLIFSLIASVVLTILLNVVLNLF